MEENATDFEEMATKVSSPRFQRVTAPASAGYAVGFRQIETMHDTVPHYVAAAGDAVGDGGGDGVGD
eukprot:2214633-Rhodomonas_salina.1